jgi:2-amino-4-hydroxy-6-hydroxymethyldihydropteridine diphosphokinase
VQRAYIGVGANLGDREATVRQAIRLLGELEATVVLRTSTLRETEPWGYEQQPAFLNGAIEVETALTAQDLLAGLLAIERRLGRRRTGVRYGPRTIDLDLLVYGDAEIDEVGLRVPHPRLQERAFALEPLVELDPGLRVPGQGRVADLLAALHSAP